MINSAVELARANLMCTLFLFLFSKSSFSHSLSNNICHCLIKKRFAAQEHVHADWMKELLRWDYTRFEILAWVGEWRHACQRNVQHSTNTLNALRELRQITPPGFSLPVPPPFSFSFGSGNSSWNIKIIQSFSAEMKALDPVHNWFLEGATIPIEPAWLPVPSSGGMYDKETRKIHGDTENVTTVRGWRSHCAAAAFMKLRAFDLLSSFLFCFGNMHSHGSTWFFSWKMILGWLVSFNRDLVIPELLLP